LQNTVPSKNVICYKKRQLNNGMAAHAVEHLWLSKDIILHRTDTKLSKEVKKRQSAYGMVSVAV
jgi:hypothetical protein